MKGRWRELRGDWGWPLTVVLGLVMIVVLVAMLLWALPAGWESWQQTTSMGRDTIIIGVLLFMWVTRPSGR